MTSKIKLDAVKHSLYILVLLALPLGLFGKAQPNQLFTKGNQQYAKADYKGAVASYEQVIGSGYSSAEIYFNLGNAYYKLGAIPSALLYYEKAHKLAPGDEDIDANLQLANSKITDKLETVPEFFLTKWWKSFLLGFSVQTLSIGSMLFYILGFLILILYIFTNSARVKKSSFYIAISCVLVGLLLILMTNRQAHYFNTHQEAIIFSNSVTVKSEPLANSKSLFVLHEGTKVHIRETSQGWIKIELSNGNIGWMESSDLKAI